LPPVATIITYPVDENMDDSWELVVAPVSGVPWLPALPAPPAPLVLHSSPIGPSRLT
jgi:hypothetical protein